MYLHSEYVCLEFVQWEEAIVRREKKEFVMRWQRKDWIRERDTRPTDICQFHALRPFVFVVQQFTELNEIEMYF